MGDSYGPEGLCVGEAVNKTPPFMGAIRMIK